MSNILKKINQLENDGKVNEAITLLHNELLKDPKNTPYQVELGNLYAINEDFEEASGCFRKAINVFKDNQDLKDALCFCLNKLGIKAFDQYNFEQATFYFEELFSYEDKNSEYLYNYGNALFHLNQFNKALIIYKKALSFTSYEDADLYNNLANTYRRLSNYKEAKKYYTKSLDIKFNNHTFIQLLHLKQKLCEWDTYEDDLKTLQKILANQDYNFPPFPMLSIPNINPREHLEIANQWNHTAPIKEINQKRQKSSNRRIKICYLSSDFKNHPLYSLFYDLLESHDLSKFEVFLLYSGDNDESIEYKKFKSLTKNFFEIKNKSDHEIIVILKNKGIDILVDLSGFTQNSRSQIIKYRPALIHINWLGYPGTLGFYQNRSLCDYIFADEFIIPPEQEKFYSEKIIKLKPNYQPNNRSKQTGTKTKLEKVNFHLPENKFIFASFNQNIKLTKEIFYTWLEILKKCKTSILWILENSDIAKDNLLKEAHKENIDPKRIVFADYVEKEIHYQRIAFADVMLDTFPYGAHTTASDMLFNNIPIVTIYKDTFPSRVCASILNSIQCNELIAKTIAEYIEIALQLYDRKEFYKELTDKIKKNKRILFEPENYVKNIENIYTNLLATHKVSN